MALLSCNNAAFAYDGRKVVSNLNFTVEPGDYLCIVGENGAGKSTLVKGLLGFIKPCEGSVTMGSGLKVNEIGYLPQQTDVQRDFPASVYEVVLSGCLNSLGMRPFYTKDHRERAEGERPGSGPEKQHNSPQKELLQGAFRRAAAAGAAGPGALRHEEAHSSRRAHYRSGSTGYYGNVPAHKGYKPP